MKTAEEVLQKNTNHSYVFAMNNEAIKAMKEYAQQVAQQALKDAAENSSIISKYGDEGMVDQILKTEIKLP